MMDGQAWLALNIFMEARDGPADRMAAVGLVTLNRARLGFLAPDRTVESAVTARDQCAWLWFDAIDGEFRRVCETADEATVRGRQLLGQARGGLTGDGASWARSEDVARRLLRNAWPAGEEFVKLSSETVLFHDPAASEAPGWVVEADLDAVIGGAGFYHADEARRASLEATGLVHPLIEAALSGARPGAVLRQRPTRRPAPETAIAGPA